ncbi:MAG: hypothetical protein IJR13_07295 [Bacteroidales bacterium]|nr:hypothetical protein [Bacteroidales bacterium]
MGRQDEGTRFMTLRQLMAQRMGMSDVRRCATADDAALLLRLLYDDEKRVGDNAAWVMTHVLRGEAAWLEAHRDQLMECAMQTTSLTQRRLVMTLLLECPIEKEQLRSDFIDLCLALMADGEQPAGLRSVAIKLAYRQCRHYPELLGELRDGLLMLDPSELLPAVRCSRQKVLKAMSTDGGGMVRSEL